MDENFDPQKEWEKKLRDKQARYNQIVLLLIKDEKGRAKENNYRHLFEVVKKQNIKKGDIITVDYYGKDTISEYCDVRDAVDEGIGDADEETGKFVRLTSEEVVISGGESDSDISIPIETISDMYHVNRPNY